MEDMMLQPGEITEDRPVIKVIGVGGGGTNAANHMYEMGICNVDFIVCNTDNQSLLHSPIPVKVQLGADGHGAGNDPEKAKAAAEYSMDKIKELLADSTKMLFITAGMGGGTGTGAAPLIAKAAKEMGILTVGIVTIPFKFEGKRRIQQAQSGVDELGKYVDSILVISTDRIAKLYHDMKLETAFGCADDILATAAKGIAEIITLPGYINVDLEDVKTVMTNSGNALMGSARAKGKDRALTAIQNALDSPLLLSSKLKGAKDILLNISYGENNIIVDELTTITEFLQEEVQCDESQIIWGAMKDPKLDDDELNVTIVATGFKKEDIDNATRNEAANTQRMPRQAAVQDVVEKQPEQPQPTSNRDTNIWNEYQKAQATGQQANSTSQPSPIQSYAPSELVDIDTSEWNVSSSFFNENSSMGSIFPDSSDNQISDNDYLNGNPD